MSETRRGQGQTQGHCREWVKEDKRDDRAEVVQERSLEDP